MVVANGMEYICNVAQRLFYMIPGTDDYNKNMGLDITTRAHRPYDSDMRDVEYEQMVMEQFLTYTDIIPAIVNAVYKDNVLTVTMTASYNGEDFQIIITSDRKVLATYIDPKNV